MAGNIADDCDSYHPIDKRGLPAPLVNEHYAELALVKRRTKNGPSYVGIARF